MLRRAHIPGPAAVALGGLAMSVAGLLGVGSPASAAGTASHYTLTRSLDVFSGQLKVVRWAPCVVRSGKTHTQVIHYKVNPAGVSSRVGFVQSGIKRLTNATGLTFHYDGTTTYVPHLVKLGGLNVFAARQQEQQTGVPLVIAWAYQGAGGQRSNLLTGDEAGVGTISWKSGTSSQLRILDGAVVIDRSRSMTLRPGYGAGGTRGTLLLHELGHAVGLQHVTDTSQVMFPFIGPNSPGGYGAGDKAGLAKVGRPAGCMTTPRLPA